MSEQGGSLPTARVQSHGTLQQPFDDLSSLPRGRTTVCAVVRRECAGFLVAVRQSVDLLLKLLGVCDDGGRGAHAA